MLMGKLLMTKWCNEAQHEMCFHNNTSQSFSLLLYHCNLPIYIYIFLIEKSIIFFSPFVGMFDAVERPWNK